MKKDYIIQLVNKKEVEELLKNYHYLSKIQKGFKSGYNYALMDGIRVVGVCIFTGIPVKELLKGMIGEDMNSSQEGLFELSRLCIDPEVQSGEYNISSWFVSRCIRELRKETNVRLILSYADDDYHKGIIYQALSFDYYGLTAKKKDFWFRKEDGTFVKHSRGKVSGKDGEWRERSRKHRYLKVYDKNIKIKWKKENYPKGEKV